MRLEFDEQLEKLNQEMIRMGMLCETSIRTSAKAVLNLDQESAKKLPELHEQVHEKDREIESLCLRLLLKQQPVATDLRTVSSALKMITDMDRIAVQSAEIGEIVEMKNIKKVDGDMPLRDMFECVIKMVTESIDAFVKRDDKIAHNVVEYDDVADNYFNKVKDAIIAHLQDKAGDAEEAIDLLMIAKYLERIADHAVNIAIWVIFSVTGVHENED